MCVLAVIIGANMTSYELDAKEEIVLSMKQDGASLKDMANTFGFSRERARQVIEAAEYKLLFTNLDSLGAYIKNFESSNRYWSLKLVKK